MYIQKIIKEINTIYLGKSEIVELCFTALLANGHILLEDVPGTGKTMLAKTISSSFHGEFSRIQSTADLLPTDIIGSDIFNLKTQEFENKQGPIFSNIVLIDEINHSVPRTQSALLEAMEERQVTIGKTTYQLPDPFFVIATHNSLESFGTFPLPDAQLDRFMMCLTMGYLEKHFEVQLFEEIMTNTKHTISLTISSDDLIELKQNILTVFISGEVLHYVVELADAIRKDPFVKTGISTRATIALARAAQSYAYLKNRDFVIPEDIKYLTPYVLSRRLTLSIEGEIKTTKRNIILNILNKIPVPVEEKV